MSDLSAKDIVIIMNRAAKLGVKSFMIGDLEINFFQNRSEAANRPSISQKTTEQQTQVAAPQAVETQEHEITAIEDWRKEQENLLNAPVLNPYEWEQEQANILQRGDGEETGEIEDAESVQV